MSIFVSKREQMRHQANRVKVDHLLSEGATASPLVDRSLGVGSSVGVATAGTGV